MDLDKITHSKNVTYRVPRKYSNQVESLIRALQAYEETADISNVDALDFMALLWLEVKMFDNIERRPRTHAERKYVKNLEDILERQYPDKVYTNTNEDNYGVKLQALQRMKIALPALHFALLNNSTLKNINEKFGEDE